MFFEIYKQLLALGEKASTQKFTPGSFTSLIRKQFSKSDYIFRTEKSYAVDPNSIIVGGLYDKSNDLEQLPHTEIILYYYPEQLSFTGSDLNWDQLSFDIAECITHEQIHRQQVLEKKKCNKYVSKCTDKELRVEQNYLGHDEEIDAYGFSIAAEAAIFNKPYNMCTMYHVYKHTFDTDRSVVVKLEQEIVKYLEQLKLEPNHDKDHSGNRRGNSR
jgi:hypothetical protein